jgi:hypothetical protein
MEKKKEPGIRHELFDYMDHNPAAVDAHGRWLSAGGERLLDLAVNSIRGEMFPYDAPQHVQASFGAFVGGATWLAKMLRNLIKISNNRTEALRMLSQADGSLSLEERMILRQLYGLTDEEIDADSKKKKAVKPATK